MIPKMMVIATLPMIEMFHPKKNFITAKTSTNMPKWASQRPTSSPLARCSHPTRGDGPDCSITTD